MKKLSEIMAEKAQKKEQRRAEREAKDLELDGAAIANQLSRSTFPVTLAPVSDLIRSFASEEGRERFRSRFSSKHRKLMESIETQIDDAWLNKSAEFIDSIPVSRKNDARRIGWNEWVEYGAAVGWSEDDVVSTIRLVFVLSAQIAQGKAEQIRARNRA